MDAPKYHQLMFIISISNSVFSGCEKLSSITIHDNATSIDSYAFQSCKNLRNFSIPPKVTSVSDCLFLSCSSLSSIEIHDNATSFGNSNSFTASYRYINSNKFTKSDLFDEYIYQFFRLLKANRQIIVIQQIQFIQR